MGNTWGRTVLSPVAGNPIRVSADGVPIYHPIGITIDWSTVVAVAADTTLKDGNMIRNGKKYLRYGQILTMIRKAEVQTVDFSGDDDPTGGTCSLVVLGQTLLAVPFNVTAEALENLIRALDAGGAVPGAGEVTVSKSSFVYTITFPEWLDNVAAITGDSAGFTGGGGDTFAITVVTTTAGTDNGKYGPYDPGATDGRQTLARDKAVILDTSILEEGSVPGLTAPASNHVGALDGGLCWRARVLCDDIAATLEDGPTTAALIAVMPMLRFQHEV